MRKSAANRAPGRLTTKAESAPSPAFYGRKTGLLKKSDPRKVILAMVIKEKTDVDNLWIAKRLVMGHPTSVSRLVSAAQKRQEKNA